MGADLVVDAVEWERIVTNRIELPELPGAVEELRSGRGQGRVRGLGLEGGEAVGP